MKKLHVVLLAVGITFLTGCMSFEDVKKQADSGNSRMAYKTGIMLKNGDGVTQDSKQAFAYFEKAFHAGNMPAAWEIMNMISDLGDVEKSKLFGDCYSLICSKKPTTMGDIYVWTFAHNMGIPVCLNYLYALQSKGKDAETYALKKQLTEIVQTHQADFTSYKYFMEKLAEIKTEAEKRDAKLMAGKGKNAEQNLTESALPEQGVRLYKDIYSGLSVKDFIQKMSFPSMDLQDATKIGDDGTKYLINTYGHRKLSFFAGFYDVIEKYSINSKDFFLNQKPSGFLLGVKFTMGGDVLVESLYNKVRKDYPDAKENDEKRTTHKYTWKPLNADFDIITLSKSWETERVRIIACSCTIELTGKEKTLPETQKQELKDKIIDGFSWIKEQQWGTRIEAAIPLKLNEKTLIIVDKKLEEQMPAITRDAHIRNMQEKESIRKQKEQKSLDF